LMQLNGGSLGLANYSLAVGSMSGVAPINLAGNAFSVGSDNTNQTYSGAISGSGSLAKTGSGMLSLAGSNTYSGPTTVNQGKLLVNGSLVGPVTVNSGGTLAGIGSLTSVTVNEDGHLAPGDSLGKLTLGGTLTLLSGEDGLRTRHAAG
jgi:autotransporter-associated beta strand protein